MQTATGLRSRDEWANVVAMFRSAAYSACLDKLQNDNSTKARLLKARSFMRLDRNREALQALSSVPDTNDAAVCGEFHSLKSIALIRLARFSEAGLAQSNAREHLANVTAWAIRAELRYHESCLYYAAGERQRSYDSSVSSERDIVNYYETSNHDFVSVSVSRAALLNVKAVVDLSYGRYVPALHSLVQSVKSFQSNSRFDVGSRARILSNLTSVMNEIGQENDDILQVVIDAEARIPWTRELAHSHFCVLREIGYSLTLSGQFSKAFETFHKAARRSTRMLDKCLSSIDCIRLLRDLGFPEAAFTQLSKLARSVVHLNLTQCKEHDADTLLLLAEYIAEVDVNVARRLLEAYVHLEANAVRFSTAFTDKRFNAHRLRLESVMAAASGDMNLSSDLKFQAFGSCDRLGMRLEASRIALELANRERAHHYRDYARGEAIRWPKSSFAVYLRSLDSEFAAVTYEAKIRKARKSSDR